MFWTAVGVGIILMSPPGQKAIKDGANAISEMCKPADPCEEINRQIRDIAGKLRTKLAQQGGISMACLITPILPTPVAIYQAKEHG